jgi:hypothetical protein
MAKGAFTPDYACRGSSIHLSDLSIPIIPAKIYIRQ